MEPSFGGGKMIGKPVMRCRDKLEGIVRQQRRKSLLVWVPSLGRNLTFRDGTYKLL